MVAPSDRSDVRARRIALVTSWVCYGVDAPVGTPVSRHASVNVGIPYGAATGSGVGPGRAVVDGADEQVVEQGVRLAGVTMRDAHHGMAGDQRRVFVAGKFFGSP